MEASRTAFEPQKNAIEATALPARHRVRLGLSHLRDAMSKPVLQERRSPGIQAGWLGRDDCARPRAGLRLAGMVCGGSDPCSRRRKAALARRAWRLLFPLGH